jgi:hypothetical protein
MVRASRTGGSNVSALARALYFGASAKLKFIYAPSNKDVLSINSNKSEYFERKVKGERQNASRTFVPWDRTYK